MNGWHEQVRRTRLSFGLRWRWAVTHTGYGTAVGYAWSERGAWRKLHRAVAELVAPQSTFTLGRVQ